jgi:hypothetical protein
MFKSFVSIALAGVTTAFSVEKFTYFQYIAEFNKNYATLEEF